MDPMTREDKFVALVPAGGSGQRIGGPTAKQYLPIGGQPMIARTLRNLLAAEWLTQVHVVVSPTDVYWSEEPVLRRLSAQFAGRLFWHPNGGSSRQETVTNGLGKISLDPYSTWVMVHDAARPGISEPLLNALRLAVESGAQGALLATRVADTVKRQRPGSQPVAEVAETVPRDRLWLAQTPQVFRLGQLSTALMSAHRNGNQFTDEASVMENTGLTVRLVEGDWRNMKVTTPGDLEFIALALGVPANAPLMNQG